MKPYNSMFELGLRHEDTQNLNVIAGRHKHDNNKPRLASSSTRVVEHQVLGLLKRDNRYFAAHGRKVVEKLVRTDFKFAAASIEASFGDINTVCFFLGIVKCVF